MTLAKGDKLAKVFKTGGIYGEKAGEPEEYHLTEGEAYHIWEIVDLSACYGIPDAVFQIVVLKKVE